VIIPLEYVYNFENGKLEIDELEADTVSLVLDKYLKMKIIDGEVYARVQELREYRRGFVFGEGRIGRENKVE
jgi:hypothetical protein